MCGMYTVDCKKVDFNLSCKPPHQKRWWLFWWVHCSAVFCFFYVHRLSLFLQAEAGNCTRGSGDKLEWKAKFLLVIKIYTFAKGVSVSEKLMKINENIKLKFLTKVWILMHRFSFNAFCLWPSGWTKPNDYKANLQILLRREENVTEGKYFDLLMLDL